MRRSNCTPRGNGKTGALWSWPLLAAIALSPVRAAADEPEVARSVAMASAPEAAPAAASPPDPSTRPLSRVGRVPIFVTGGLAVVLLGVGTVYGAMSISDHSSFDAHPTTATANAGESHELTADMCFGGALTLGLVSLVMALTHHEDALPATPATQSVSRATFLPVVSPRGAGLAVRF